MRKGQRRKGRCPMHTKSKYPWLRHLDFMALDMLSLLGAFTIAFAIKFCGLWLISGEGWVNTVWARLVLLFTLADVVFTFLLNPYSGIFKRKYYMEIVQALRLSIFNAISVALILYVFKTQRI